MADVCLVYVPFGALERPSLALGILKSALVAGGMSSEVVYCTFDFAERIGLELYSKLAWVREEMIGEWIFAGAAFPDFRFDHDAYLDRVIDSFYPGADERARVFGREFLLFARAEAERFIDDQARAILRSNPRIVACSSTFNQNCAMLALTRRIKELDPNVVTVVGGANCEGEMGVTMARSFPWLDYVASGEAEGFFADFCRQILDGTLRHGSLPYGIIAGRGERKQASRLTMIDREQGPPRAMLENMDASPIPDFDDYFAALERYADRDYITPGLVAETARGCWWGASHHCTFCGLNGGSMEFRSKSPDRVASELRQLSVKYGIQRFMMADNILDTDYYKSLLPVLSELPEKYDLYFEIKSNVTHSQIQLLRSAGIGWVVAGVESLHDEVLKLMDKGTPGWLNVQMLKWTRGVGVHVSWNMLCGLPGEQDAWYGEMAELIPSICHLEPPNDVRIIRFDRFSPYQARQEQFGLRLRPSWPYKYIYPLPEDELQKLVYFFEEDGRAPVKINPFRQQGRDAAFRSLGGPGRDALQERVHEWVRSYRSPEPPILKMTEEASRTTIVDTRPIAPRRHVVLEGLAHRVHRICDRALTLSSIVNALSEDGGPAVTAAEVTAQLQSLVDDKLVLRMGQRYLALAARDPMPELPWKNQDGYPGGWFVYPRPAVVPPGFPIYLREKRSSKEAPPADAAPRVAEERAESV